MRKAAIITGLGLLGLVALATAPSARPLNPAEESGIRPVGKPISCVRLEQIDETRVRNDHTIDFYLHGGKVLRNTLPYDCSQLGAEERFSYNTDDQQLCSSDTITVLTGVRPMKGPICGLGAFQEITGAPRAH